MGDSTYMVAAWINPFRWFDAERPAEGNGASVESFLRFAFRPTLDATVPAAARRYHEVFEYFAPIFMVPAEARVLDRLIWPLRGAIVDYMLGNYTGTIALCATAGEVVALLHIEASSDGSDPARRDDERRKWERKPQAERVKRLTKDGLVGSSRAGDYERLIELRRQYLHWLDPPDSAETDARSALEAAAAVVSDLLQLGTSGTHATLNPRLLTYLGARGLLSVRE